MVLRQMPNHPRILEEGSEIGDREYQVQMVGSVGLLNQLELSVEPRRFLTHQIDLSLVSPRGVAALPSTNWLAGVAATIERT